MSETISLDPAAMRTLARTLADTLTEGWNRGRVDQMMEVFAEEATFIETPFSAPLNGASAIRQWLSDIPYHQSDVTFTTGEVFVAALVSAEFKLVFQRRTTGDWVDARGALFAETDGSKITELRMYWHRWNGGKETSLP